MQSVAVKPCSTAADRKIRMSSGGFVCRIPCRAEVANWGTDDASDALSYGETEEGCSAVDNHRVYGRAE